MAHFIPRKNNEFSPFRFLGVREGKAKFLREPLKKSRWARERQAQREGERCHWLCVPVALFLPCSAAQGRCALKQRFSVSHTHTHAVFGLSAMAAPVNCWPLHRTPPERERERGEREKEGETTKDTVGKANNWPLFPDGPIPTVQHTTQQSRQCSFMCVCFISTNYHKQGNLSHVSKQQRPSLKVTVNPGSHFVFLVFSCHCLPRQPNGKHPVRPV